LKQILLTFDFGFTQDFLFNLSFMALSWPSWEFSQLSSSHLALQAIFQHQNRVFRSRHRFVQGALTNKGYLRLLLAPLLFVHLLNLLFHNANRLIQPVRVAAHPLDLNARKQLAGVLRGLAKDCA
jgi:hypothetical protein